MKPSAGVSKSIGCPWSRTRQAFKGGDAYINILLLLDKKVKGVYDIDMNDTMFTEDEMRSRVRDKLGEYETQRALAEAIGITEGMLSKILKGERDCGERVANFFELKMIRLYVVPVDSATARERKE